MQRRQFLALLGGAATWPLAVRAQQPMTPLVGFLHSASAGPNAPNVAAFLQGLNEAGYIDGQNVAVEYRWANGQYEQLSALAAELVALRVALIVAGGGDRPAVAAKAATQTIPIVFTGSDFPVKIGLVASLSRPGGNVTGVSLFTSEVEVKRFALLRELTPMISRMAMLVNPNNPSADTAIRDVNIAASAAGQQVDVLRAANEREIDLAFATFAPQRPEALLVAHDPFFLSRRDQIVALVARHAVPAIYEFRDFVIAGGLMSYGSRLTDNYRLVGIYAGRILKGEKPADLPVQQPTKLELGINLKTAKALGLTIPSGVLSIADEIIE